MIGHILGFSALAQHGGGAGAPAPTGAVPHGAPLTMLVPALTILATVLCGLCAALRVKSKLPAWISVACLGGAFAAVLATYLGQGTGGPFIAHGFDWITFRWGVEEGQALTADFAFYVDSLSLLWMLFVTGLGALIALYASEYMAHDVGAGYCRFFAAFNLFVFMMSCLVLADNLLLLYLGWEGVGLCSYLLIGYFYKRPSAVAAAKKAFIVNRIGDLGLALGVMLAFVQFGSVEYAVIFEKAAPYIQALKDGHVEEIPFLVGLIPVLLMVGAFGKSAQLPLYVWLPDAMEGPTPVSALIHAATMVTAGVFLVARAYPLFLLSEWALPAVAWIGGLTALLSATIGMAQFDIKRIMAYSTVSQLGYMFAGLGVLTSAGACFHVFTHAFFKAALFLCCGAVMHGFAGQLDLRKLSGVGRLPGWKVTTVAMLVGCLNLAGFPLITAGYWSKDMILGEAFANPHTQAVGWILLLTAGLTAYYTFRVFFRVFVGPVEYEPGDEVHGHEEHGESEQRKANSEHGGRGEHGAHGAHGAHGGAGHDAPHPGHFHPHAPQWAINTVLALLAIGAFAIIPLTFMGEHGGWAGSMVDHSSAKYLGAAAYQHPDAGLTDPGHQDPGHQDQGHQDPGHQDPASPHAPHAKFFGFDAHKAMMVVSGVVGIIGIAVAYLLHLRGRTSAAVSRADALLPKLGPIPRWAQHKWYVDEFYHWLIVRPLWVLSHIFRLIDALIVDGLVNLFGALPRWIAWGVRPSQAGVLHGYALGMAGGIAVLLVIIWIATQ